jgi:hypothetical protein
MEGAATYEGGCHCGAVRFRVVVESHEALDCNCSICSKKGFLHLVVAKERFSILCGQQALSTYRFNTGVALHTFCSSCGVHPFYTPRSHPDAVDVNVRCLDGDTRTRFEVRSFDGRNWEESVGSIRQGGSAPPPPPDPQAVR